MGICGGNVQVVDSHSLGSGLEGETLDGVQRLEWREPDRESEAEEVDDGYSSIRSRDVVTACVFCGKSSEDGEPHGEETGGGEQHLSSADSVD